MTYFFISDLHVDFFLKESAKIPNNPIGYLDENPYAENNLRRGDFLMEL